jgi:hypothetical protein
VGVQTPEAAGQVGLLVVDGDHDVEDGLVRTDVDGCPRRQGQGSVGAWRVRISAVMSSKIGPRSVAGMCSYRATSVSLEVIETEAGAGVKAGTPVVIVVARVGV